jgi:hypothetical protein
MGTIKIILNCVGYNCKELYLAPDTDVRLNVCNTIQKGVGHGTVVEKSRVNGSWQRLAWRQHCLL